MARRNNDDDAPWLAEAPPPARTEVSRRSFFWTLFIGLALATIAVVGVILLMAKKDGGSTQGYMNAEQAPVITAEPGPYKIRPVDPGGARIDGIDGTMYSAGEGIDAGSAIDPSLAPEAPLPRPGTGVPQDLLPPETADPATLPPGVTMAPPQTIAPAIQKPAPAKIAPPAPVKVTPPPAAPKPIPPTPAATRAGNVQLGAFSSEEKANAAWAGVAGKHGLAGKRIIAVESGGRTLYRLRASSADPAATCAKMKAAGDACAPVE